ncbi:DUF456 domain-containing protein [Rubrivivax gelatinosus]|uniref:DUF456 domain-containing protein n=1 Tax=Rubrivivax gelatinosus TaxID=28068 RepID=UPI0005C17912|nr:DUF456 domain-containing protein [Rubrivivax gelatinosus]MBG6081776.1 hypothetical protein [Rubrivivax gelatinosus]
MNNEYQKNLIRSISICPIWPAEATRKIGQMIGEINQANAILGNISAAAQKTAIKGGFAAETFHAESFNLDAILKDKDVRAFTDAFKQTPLMRNDPTHDIVVMKDGEQVLGAQLKYFKDADATQKAFRSTRDGVHHYERADRFIGPSDQIEDIQASAHKTVLKNQQSRPEVARAAEKVRDHTAGRIEVDGAQSTSLGKAEAEQLGAGTQQGKDLHQRMQDGYLNKAAVQQSLRAAGSAAVVTAVTAGCINAFQSIKLVRDGELSAEQAALRILRDTAIAAGDSALKAGSATATVSLAAQSLPSLFSGSAFQTSLASGAIAGATVCAVDLVQCLVLFSAGKMTREELETRTGKNIFQTGAAVAGASVGGAIGALGGPVGILIGSLVGGMITSLAMSIALDNHFEKPFRIALAATEQVVKNGLDAHGAMQYLQASQAYFAEFHQGLLLSERHFEQQIKIMQAQSTRLKNRLNNL